MNTARKAKPNLTLVGVRPHSESRLACIKRWFVRSLAYAAVAVLLLTIIGRCISHYTKAGVTPASSHTTLAPGLECYQEMYRGSLVKLVTVDLRQHGVDLLLPPEGAHQSLSQLMASSPRHSIELAFNGGFINDDGKPVGLVAHNGKVQVVDAFWSSISVNNERSRSLIKLYDSLPNQKTLKVWPVILSGGPRVLDHGTYVVDEHKNGWLCNHTARTAVAVTADGQHLLILVAQGPPKWGSHQHPWWENPRFILRAAWSYLRTNLMGFGFVSGGFSGRDEGDYLRSKAAELGFSKDPDVLNFDGGESSCLSIVKNGTPVRQITSTIGEPNEPLAAALAIYRK